MDDQPEVTKEQLYRAAVGKRKDEFYAPNFLAFEESESRRSWTWAAVLFGPIWYLYRPSVIFNFLLIPIYADYLYFSNVEKRIGSLREKLPDDAAVLQALRNSRQASILACVVGPLAVAGVFVVAAYFGNNGEGDTQISAVLTEISGVQSAVVKSYVANHVWSERAPDLGFREPIHSPYIDALNIDRGTITVRFGREASPLIAGHFLSLRPSLAKTGAAWWSCGYAAP